MLFQSLAVFFELNFSLNLSLVLSRPVYFPSLLVFELYELDL